MKTPARQLTIDMYNCEVKKLKDEEEVKAELTKVVGKAPSMQASTINEEHFALVAAFEQGHIAIHIYKEYRYVAMDIFTFSDETEAERLGSELRKYFQPEKMKSTFLKRGDFGKEREIKPKTKSKFAPLKKIKTTGAKVIKTLKGGND